MTQEIEGRRSATAEVGPMIMAAFALPLFVWSAFNAGYFDLDAEAFIIPLAILLGGAIGFGGAMWAYQRHQTYLATMAAIFGAFWLTYGAMLWLMQNGVIDEDAVTGDLRGLLFSAWAVSMAILWLASIREHWTYMLVTLGAAVMFVVLAIGHFAGDGGFIEAGGWVGFVTAVLAWYSALADMLNMEFERPVLPTDVGWFRGLRLRGR
ncbi:MAG TPA: acetate uptake transporter [Dehalococcoidia bacterium]|nr:acetate uptake transporter [Dehalococcoidia bacterium]